MADGVQKVSSELLLAHLARRGISLTDRRLRQLATEGHFPEPVRGDYEFLATLTGLISYYRQLYEKKSGGILEEEHRIAVAKRRQEEVKANDAERLVEDIAEVERSRIALVVMIRQKLLALPAKAASYLACCTDERQLTSELEKQIEAILRDLETPAFTARPDPLPENGAGEQPGA